MNKNAHFPASRELFKLVRHFATQRENDDLRLSDADLGRLIGFESARTSRWKYGQIAVSDAARLLSLAGSFDIDISVLTRVAAGDISADEALEILSSNSRFARFLGEELLLPSNEPTMTISSDDGTSCRVTRRSPSHYHRTTRKADSIYPAAGDHEHERTVLIADDDETTMEIFRNLTTQGTGLVGVAARSATEALLLAGSSKPNMIIYDLFMPDCDGFAAVRTLAALTETRGAEIVATSLIVTPDIKHKAIGSGALELIQRPLRARPLGRLLSKLRRRQG